MDLTYTNVKITFGDNKSGENKELDNVFVMSYSKYLYSVLIIFQVKKFLFKLEIFGSKSK